MWLLQFDESKRKRKELESVDGQQSKRDELMTQEQTLKERGLSFRKVYRARHREKILAYNRKYNEDHPEQKEIYGRRCRIKKREFVNRLKMCPCSDCGIQYNPWVMHFDHREASGKVFNISEGPSLGISNKLIMAEIEKCDVVCANCHAERTHKKKLCRV